MIHLKLFLLTFGIIGIFIIWGAGSELRNIEYAIVQPLTICEQEDSVCWIRYYSHKYNIPSKLPLRVAWCESGYVNQCNKQYGCGAGQGIFMFIKSTWEAKCDGSIDNIRSNIACGVKLISQGEISRWGTSNTRWGTFSCWRDYKIK